MKMHCLLNTGSKFNTPNIISQYIDRLEGDVIAFTYARMHIEEINKFEWDALHIYTPEKDKKHIRTLANIITCLICKPKEVYFLGDAYCCELLLIIRDKWPSAKVFTQKQILS